ncbi:MAG: hypothetical protein K6E83_08960 [Clostridium sp.]|nr:hypothetical protein [Clostridium sp.]
MVRGSVTVKMMGRPSVTVNGRTLRIHYQKAEALLYYVVYRKSVTKSDAAFLLWNGNRKDVFRNLRNILYLIRKACGESLLVADEGGRLIPNPELEWKTDVDEDRQEGLEKGNNEIFLEGFDVKKAEGFDEWQTQVRTYIRDLYLHEKKKTILRDSFEKQWEEMERSYLEYLRKEPYDEDIVIQLMENYRERQLYYKAAEIYLRLRNSLIQEMGIRPMKETTTLYYRILQEWNRAADGGPILPQVPESLGSPGTQQIMDVLSFFPEGAPFSLLEKLFDKKPMELLYLCGELESGNILRISNSEPEVMLSFVSPRFRNTVYEKLSPAHRRLMHLQIAGILEKQAKPGELEMNTQLANHFSGGGNRKKSLEYRIKNLETYVNMHCDLMEFELYTDFHYGTAPAVPPALSGEYSTEQGILAGFEVLSEEVKQCRLQGGDEVFFDRLEKDLLFLRGRFGIYQGDYRTGCGAMRRLLRHSDSSADTGRILQVHRELAYAGMQTVDPDMMRLHLQEGYRLAEEKNMQMEKAFYERLFGACCVMTGAYGEAERFLDRSRKTFEQFSGEMPKFADNIAYAHGYLGDSLRKRGEFGRAEEELRLAVDMFANKQANSAAVLHVMLGQTLFARGAYGEARKEFRKADKLFRSFWGLTGRGINSAFLALFDAMDGEDAEALRHLQNAERFSSRLGHKTEQGHAALLKGYLKKHLSEDGRNRGILLKELEKPAEAYLALARQQLSVEKDCYELEWVDRAAG